MIDQATELRNLVQKTLREQPSAVGPPPRLIALLGGKGGVGVTTVAVNLSIAIAARGERVAILDTDPHRSDVATLCGINEQRPQYSGVRQSLHEMLVPGPAGIQVVPGLCEQAGEVGYERLLRELSVLGKHVDVVVLDLGSRSGELHRRLSLTADEVLLVTTPNDVAVMDSYARIKTDLSLVSTEHIRLVVNQTDDYSQAEEVHLRIDRSCQKFLQSTIELAGHIPKHDVMADGDSWHVPFVVSQPMSAASRAVGQLTDMVVPSSVIVPSKNRVKVA